MAPKRHKKRCAAAALEDDPIITDVDTDSDLEQHAVRLPPGLTLDMLPPAIPEQAASNLEQECQRQLLNQYIEMDVFQRLAKELDSDPLRPSTLCRRGLTSKSFTVGAFYHAGTVGIRCNTKEHPWISALLAYMVRACTHMPFASVSLLCNVRMTAHCDKYNMEDTDNMVIPVSRFRQGQLWIEDDHGPDLSPAGKHRGRNHAVKLPGVQFDPRKLHATCPWKHDRIVLSAYTTKKIGDLKNQDKKYLRALGFNL